MIWPWLLLKVVVWNLLTLKAAFRVELAAETLDADIATLPGTGLRAPLDSDHVKWQVNADTFCCMREPDDIDDMSESRRAAVEFFPMVEASLVATSSHGGLSPVLRSTSLVEGSSGCSSSQVVAEGGASAGDAYNVVTSQLGMKYWCRCGIAVVADDSSLCLRCMASVERALYGDADMLDVVPLMLKVVGGGSLLAEGHAEGNGCSVCVGPGRREAVVRIHKRSALIDGEGEAHRRSCPYVQPGPSEPHRSIRPWARSSNAKDKYGFAMRNAEGAAPLKGELSQQLKLFTNVALHAADPIVTRRIVSSNRVRQLLSLIIRYHSK